MYSVLRQTSKREELSALFKYFIVGVVDMYLIIFWLVFPSWKSMRDFQEESSKSVTNRLSRFDYEDYANYERTGNPNFNCRSRSSSPPLDLSIRCPSTIKGKSSDPSLCL